MSIKIFLTKKLRLLIRSEIYALERDRANSLLNSYKESATFDINTVRIDPSASINNTQKDKSKIVIGNNSWIKGEMQISKHGGCITIGNDCFIGEGSRIWSSVNIKIGDRVLVSHNVNIHDNASHPLTATERHKDFLHIRHIGLQDKVNISEKEITIEDDAWLGFNSTILRGVTIGRGAIVGANTVITKDVPPFAIVVGNPAQIIKYTT